MARYAPLTLQARDAASFVSTSASVKPKQHLFLRFFEALIAARQLQADRAVARILARSGHKLTDSIEREIERRLISKSAD